MLAAMRLCLSARIAKLNWVRCNSASADCVPEASQVIACECHHRITKAVSVPASTVPRLGRPAIVPVPLILHQLSPWRCLHTSRGSSV